MKKLLCIICSLMIIVISVPALAADIELDAALDKSSYNIGDTALITVNYNLPHEGNDDAVMKFHLNGLDNLSLKSAQTLVCDDTSCVMHEETDFLDFSDNKLNLKAGYSGTVTFSATVLNEKEVELSIDLTFGSDTVSASKSAKVADYKSEPAPTAIPTEQPEDIEPESSDSLNNTDNASSPKTGYQPAGTLAACLIAAGVLTAIIQKKYKN